MFIEQSYVFQKHVNRNIGDLYVLWSLRSIVSGHTYSLAGRIYQVCCHYVEHTPIKVLLDNENLNEPRSLGNSGLA